MLGRNWRLVLTVRCVFYTKLFAKNHDHLFQNFLTPLHPTTHTHTPSSAEIVPTLDTIWVWWLLIKTTRSTSIYTDTIGTLLGENYYLHQLMSWQQSTFQSHYTHLLHIKCNSPWLWCPPNHHSSALIWKCQLRFPIRRGEYSDNRWDTLVFITRCLFKSKTQSLNFIQ